MSHIQCTIIITIQFMMMDVTELNNSPQYLLKIVSLCNRVCYYILWLGRAGYVEMCDILIRLYIVVEIITTSLTS